MITLAWYLLKVIACSGILCGYYFLALRNKVFHRWNRFYLLASIVLSLAIPMMKFNILRNTDQGKGTVVNLLQTVNSGNEIIIEYSRSSGLHFNSENLVLVTYIALTLLFLSIFIFSLYRIFHLKRIYPQTSLEGINLISTDADGTPFSFFNSIFWNNSIDICSKRGQQIFNHEIAHVREKHSYDKIFLKIVLILFWINPFFWIFQKELGMIHEFIADKEALEDEDVNAFAEMILQTVYPNRRFALTNNLFHSPIKRRLIMFTKNKKSRVTYISRLLVLPIIAILFVAFTIKLKSAGVLNFYAGKKIVVVIDPGHGGEDAGAIENNINEKDLNLSIAREIARLNKNERIQIVLSRETDETKSPKDRVSFTEKQKADLFISIHVDAEENKNSHDGLVIFIPKNGNPFLEDSKLLGSALIESFKDNYTLTVANKLQQREQGIWVLKANPCPSVLLETGYMSTEKDLEYLLEPTNQRRIAQNILNAIEKYASATIESIADTRMQKDTIPTAYYKNKNIASLIISDKDDRVFITYKNGSKETITKEELGKRNLLLPPPPPPPPLSPPLPPPPPPPPPTVSMLPTNAVYVLDGLTVTREEASGVDQTRIEKINVLKGDEAINEYGKKGRNGVYLIFTNKSKTMNAETFLESPVISSNPVYMLDGKEISKEEMNRISTETIKSINVIKGNSAIGKYGEKGKKGVVKITRKQVNNGSFSQRDTLPDHLLTKVENEAEFPGGHEKWISYMVNKIKGNMDSLSEKDFGTCLLKFIVNTDGSVSHVEATTMKESKLAMIAVNALREGPNWIPASENGHVVASYRLQPVTLTNPQ